MKHGLEPVLFPEKDFHVLFRLRMAAQDPLPVVSRFLRRALQEGLLDRTAVIGRMLTPLGYVAVMENGRLHAFVFVQWGDKTYATRYTIFPSRSNLRRWYQLARDMGDARWLGTATDESAQPQDELLAANPHGIRWCPACEGLNLRFLLRCIWCHRELPPDTMSLPASTGRT